MVIPMYLLNHEWVACDALHGFEQKTADGHSFGARFLLTLLKKIANTLCSEKFELWIIHFYTIQGSHKNLRKKFHDFSKISPGQNPNFQIKKYQYLFLRPMHQFVETITDWHRCTLTHTDTHMIWSRPTDYSIDFISNWTDSRSLNYTCSSH